MSVRKSGNPVNSKEGVLQELPSQPISVSGAGCVDVWDPKVLRSGAGAHFRCHMIPDVTWDMIGNYLPEDCKVLLADNKSKHSDFVERTQKKNVKESETEGRFDDILAHESDDDDIDSDSETKTRTKKGRKGRISISTVFETDFTSRESAIVIGGETHGLSPRAYNLAAEFAGSSIYIPMMPGVESVNAAMATTGILFEARRQFLFENTFSEDYNQNRKNESVGMM